MSLEKLISESIAENPLEVKAIFEEEMKKRMLEALEEKFKSSMMEADDEDEDEDEDDADEDDDEDEDDLDEKACVAEMKKLHASACSKNEMYKKVSEKYGCTKETFNKLHASYCAK